MTMRIVDLTPNESPAFLKVLKAETRGGVLELSAPGGWVNVARPFPDLALMLSSEDMQKLTGRVMAIAHTVDIEHVRALHDAQEPLSSSRLLEKVMSCPSALDTLGVAFPVPFNYSDLQVLNRLSGISPGMSAVAYCPSAIKEKATQLHKSISWIPRGKVLRALQQFVIYHEFGHTLIDPRFEIGDKRLHEGFAGFLAYGSLKDNESRDVAQAFSGIFQHPKYNYYLLLVNLEETKRFLSQVLNGDLSGLFESFYDVIVEQPLYETQNRTLNVGGDIRLWPGFGARNAVICCGGEITGVANLKSGVVIARSIRMVEGFLTADVDIYTNHVEYVSRLAERANIVHIIPASQLDLGALATSGMKVNDMIAVCKGEKAWVDERAPKPALLYNVCVPCQCGVFIVTEETTHSPLSIDLSLKRLGVCDKCGTLVEYRGNEIALLRVDEDWHPFWHIVDGSSRIEKRFRETERWLEKCAPATVMERLKRSRDTVKLD